MRPPVAQSKEEHRILGTNSGSHQTPKNGKEPKTKCKNTLVVPESKLPSTQMRQHIFHCLGRAADASKIQEDRKREFPLKSWLDRPSFNPCPPQVPNMLRTKNSGRLSMRGIFIVSLQSDTPDILVDILENQSNPA